MTRFDSTQFRTLAVNGAALPTYGLDRLAVFTPVRLRGAETLGALFEYTLELKTPDVLAFSVGDAANLDLDRLIGTEVTVLIELEGRGTFIQGMQGETGIGNLGAGIREITGLVTAASFVREEGRSMVYALVLRPWLWLATKTQNCRLFQNLDVVEITDAVLSVYPFPVEKRLFFPGARTPYPKRDIQCQHWESDWAFLQRLWEEWGIFYWFEYGDGRHRLILADAMAAHKPHGDAYRLIRYEAPTGKRIDEEHIHALSVKHCLITGGVASVDYDYTRPHAYLVTKYEDPRTTAHAFQEHYAWGDYAQPQAGAAGFTGERNEPQTEAGYLAQVRMEALRCEGLRAKGRGNLRGLMTGHTFTLTHYPQTAANREYVVVSSTLDIEEIAEATGTAQRYRCETEFEIQPVSEVFRLMRSVAKPRASGPETAVVVGPKDQEIWTDAYGRVKVQFAWDRMGKCDANSSCWLRVSSPWQGNQFGATYLPRVGQEVLVAHIHGDPDLPVVTGCVVNAFNQPPWRLPDNHALSGIRSKALDGGGASELVMDDTNGEIQAQLSSDHGTSQLSLGFLRRISGNRGRQEPRGSGYELRTDFWGVVRAGMGMLVTTEPGSSAQSPVKEMGETVMRLTQAGEVHKSLTETAHRHDAQMPGADQREVVEAIAAQNRAIRGGVATDDNSFPQFAEPHLTISSPAGIQSTTAGSTHIASEEHLALTTGEHVGIAAGKSLFAAIREGCSIFAHKLGMRLVAAAGKVRIEAQSDNVEIVAQQVVKFISMTDWINLTAKEGIRLNGGGTEIEINGAGIRGLTEGQFLVHASSYATEGPLGKPPTLPELPTGETTSEWVTFVDHRTGKPIANLPYRLDAGNGRVAEGVTDVHGRTGEVWAPVSQPVTVHTQNIQGTTDTYHVRHLDDVDGAA